MFWAQEGKFEACGIFSLEHLVLFSITIICICIALKFTKKCNEQQVRKIIKVIVILIWILEIIKIIFNLLIGNGYNFNKYIPLYFCSLILYAGIFSGFCTGKLKRIGDVFLATGGIIAGIGFMVYPYTSLNSYPVFHYISIQSFILHGAMVYIGILMNKTKYIKITHKDIIYYSGLIIVISIFAYIFNLIFDTNLMFISKNFPGTLIEVIYNNTGIFFPIIMTIAQAVIPFYLIYVILKCNKNAISL